MRPRDDRGGDHLAGPPEGDAPRKESAHDRTRMRGLPTQPDEEERRKKMRWLNHA
jgi:hypothetical protein